MSPSSIIDIDNITRKINIPPDIKAKSIDDVSLIVNSNMQKQDLCKELESNLYKLKIKPLSYLDEKKYYSYIDAAYNIYKQLSLEKDDKKNTKHSKLFAWCVANSALYNWYFKTLIGNEALSGIEVEREVDYALRTPIQYIIKNCLYGLVKFAIAGGLIWTGFYQTNLTKYQWHALCFYIISIIINLIKVSIRIYKGNIYPLDIIKPGV